MSRYPRMSAEELQAATEEASRIMHDLAKLRGRLSSAYPKSIIASLLGSHLKKADSGLLWLREYIRMLPTREEAK